MKLLICSFFSDNYAEIFFESIKKYRPFDDCGFFVASEVCSNWPKDFNISKLKNKCLDAASNLMPDWMVLLPGCDSSLLELPNLNKLNNSILYFGVKKQKVSDWGEKCSLHLYSKNIYCNYRYDESYNFFYDDYDFFYNQTANIEKSIAYNFSCYHKNHVSLIENAYIAEKNSIEKDRFLKEYKRIHNKNFYE